jgi:hypothetical protein
MFLAFQRRPSLDARQTRFLHELDSCLEENSSKSGFTTRQRWSSKHQGGSVARLRRSRLAENLRNSVCRSEPNVDVAFE